MSSNNKPLWEDEDEVDVLDEIKETNKLIVYNDDVNSFEHVIQTLRKVCKHTMEQAEQCTIIIHTKGKCSVKSGSYTELEHYKYAINDRGINAEIE